MGSGASSDYSFDQSLHLCANGRYIYDTVSYVGGAGYTNPNAGSFHGDQNTQRVSGGPGACCRRLGRHGSGSARVREWPDGGGRPVTVTIATNGRDVTIDAVAHAATRSDLC